MYRFTLFVMAAGLMGLLTTGFGAVAQNPGTTQPAKPGDSQTKRIVYVVQHGVAKDLATVLGKHFKGDAEFEAAPDAAGHMLLISANADVFNEVVATLDKLDRRPQMVAVDIIILEVSSTKGADGKVESGGAVEKQLSGPGDRVLDNIKKLQSQGAITDQKHYQLVTLENQTTRLVTHGSKPYITGSVTANTTGKPRTANTVAYRDAGTQVTVTPSVAADGIINMNVNLEDSRMALSTVAVSTDDKGQPLFATEFPVVTYIATLSLKSGQAVIAKDVQTTSKAGNLLGPGGGERESFALADVGGIRHH